MNEEQVISRCKGLLESHYASQFQGVVLYGSIARNQADSSSDIDLLVLLRPPFEYLVELQHIIDLLYPVQLESDRLISAKPASSEEFEQGTRQLYRIAKREGAVV